MILRDNVAPGQYYSADYLRDSRLDESATFRSMFKLVRMAGKFGENEAVLFTSTQGAKKLYVFANYYVESI